MIMSRTVITLLLSLVEKDPFQPGETSVQNYGCYLLLQVPVTSSFQSHVFAVQLNSRGC